MMNRLTDGRKTVSMCISSDECFRYNRLAAYEDNGQTPQEQAAMIAENARLCEMIIAERAAHKELDEAIAKENARLKTELEATVRQITSTRACKMCVHREHAPIDGPCAKCHRPHKSNFEWERPRAENGGIK